MADEKQESIVDKLPLPEPEIYYDAPHRQYWLKDEENAWYQANEAAAIQELDGIGYSAKPEKGKKYSEADIKLAELRKTNHITYAGAVAGNKAGVLSTDAGRVLITRGPRLATPVKGDWSAIWQLGTRLLGEKQFVYMLGWCQNAVRGVMGLGEEVKPGQLLVLAGPAGCGKSFWQNRVITPLLGGRCAKPVQFMSGTTTFNSDLIASEHLMLEDESFKTDLKSRRGFSAAIKNFTVNPTQRAHGKGQNAVSVPSRHWLSMSLNDEPENLAVLPPLEQSINDKLMLFKCEQAINNEWPGDKTACTELQKTVLTQIPAFMFHLVFEYDVPKVLENTRYGIDRYHHPEIVERINCQSPEAQLEYLIDACYDQKAKEKGVLEAKQEEIQLTLMSNPTLQQMAGRLLSWPTATGTYLSKLADQNPDKFIKPSKHQKPHRLWKIRW